MALGMMMSMIMYVTGMGVSIFVGNQDIVLKSKDELQQGADEVPSNRNPGLGAIKSRNPRPGPREASDQDFFF